MGEQRRLGILAESEKTISEVSTIAIAGTEVGELIIYDTVSSRKTIAQLDTYGKQSLLCP